MLLGPISNSATDILSSVSSLLFNPWLMLMAANADGRISVLGCGYSGSGTRCPKFGLRLPVLQKGMGKISLLSEKAMALCP